ncbi:hypothetical protein [Bacteroides finegoldii]|jgi:hypothetical protein|uniref:hypothetical protein n=1 Tax=Bacteroides finegoldii TaxID=338188 RepID=UPI00189DFCF7|nr:hypothetical protein [Bacteroides finegoldii]
MNPDEILKSYAQCLVTAYCLSEALKEEVVSLASKIEHKDEKEILDRINARVLEVHSNLKSQLNLDR